MLHPSGLLISEGILILWRKFSAASLKLFTIFVFCLTISALKDLISSLSPFVTLTWIFAHATDFFIILLILTLFFLSLHAIIRSLAVIRHPFTLTKPIVRLNSRKYSFFSRIVDPWNALLLVVVSSLTLTSFKYKLKYTLLLLIILNLHCFRISSSFSSLSFCLTFTSSYLAVFFVLCLYTLIYNALM